MKSKGVAYLLWLFFGLLGIHKFYVGKIGMGILYILTGGLFGIGWILDLFTLGRQVDMCNALHGYRAANTNSNTNNNVNNIVINIPPQTVSGSVPVAASATTNPSDQK